VSGSSNNLAVPPRCQLAGWPRAGSWPSSRLLPCAAFWLLAVAAGSKLNATVDRLESQALQVQF
jgi:hypothetical protein